jgi:predicted TIM-barrel fold metal-dependent hydrolase
MVIDAHVHIQNPEPEHLRNMLAAADRAGIHKLCISSLSRTWSEFPTTAQIEEAAQDVLDACAAYPDRFVGGVYASADHLNVSLDMIERCIADGPCRFVKLWVSQYADEPRLDPVYERAIALDAPVLAHSWIKATGNMTRESTCHNVVNAARRHPALKIWLAHFSGRWEETARVVRDAPNVCMDLSGGEPEDGIVECLLRHVGAERLFFGSDAPGRNFAVQMTKVTSADIGEAERRMILGENIRRWLHV